MLAAQARCTDTCKQECLAGNVTTADSVCRENGQSSLACSLATLQQYGNSNNRQSTLLKYRVLRLPIFGFFIVGTISARTVRGEGEAGRGRVSVARGYGS